MTISLSHVAEQWSLAIFKCW